MTDFTPKEPVHNEVFYCEQHGVAFAECCVEAKSIGWFFTYG
jgi:hypothetical protein